MAALLLVDTGPGFRDETAREAWNAWVGELADDLEATGLAALRPGPESAAADHQAGADGLAAAARAILIQRNGEAFESLGMVAVPTLIVVGADDDRFLPAADAMARRIPGARRVDHRERRPRREHGPARAVQSRRARVPGGAVNEGLTVRIGEDHVATVEFDRPPNNHFDVELIAALADSL